MARTAKTWRTPQRRGASSYNRTDFVLPTLLVIKHRRMLVVLTLCTLFIALIALAYHVAVAKLKTAVETALGPQSEIAAIDVGWRSVTVRGLRVHAPAGWPTDDTLRAKLVIIEPSLRSLLAGDIHIAAIHIDGAYLSVWRTSASKIRLLPSLLEKPASDDAKPSATSLASASPRISIDAIHLSNASIAFIDSSLAHEVKLDLSALDVDLDSLQLPALDSDTKLHLAGSILGPQHTGTITIDGHATLATRDSNVKLTLNAVDLLPLAPYLLKASETGIKQGQLDFQIESTVKQQHLHAPGQITLHDLALDPRGTFIGQSQSLAVALLKNHQGTISTRFALDGNLDDPHFSLNDSLLHRASSQLADSMGVSVEGLTRNVSNAAGGIGSKLKGLLHR